jgi:ATP-dependent Clp protease ATP-binding subunit ClpA
MYERFTDRARKAMQLANQEAQRLNHEYIGTEHILLGLVKEGAGVAANVLKNLDVDLRKIRLETEKIVQSGPDAVTMGKLPQTPWAKKVIEYSIEEARIFDHNYVGTEHLLIGLLREEEGVAAQVLMNLGIKLEYVREETLNLLGQGGSSDDSVMLRKTSSERPRKTSFERVARESGLWLHRNLRLVLTGVALTVLGGVVAEVFLGHEYSNHAALLLGAIFLVFVIVKSYISQRMTSAQT